MGFPGPIPSFVLPVAWLPAGLTRHALVRRGWLIFLVGGLGIAAGAALNGDHRAAQPLLTVASVIAATTMVIGVRIHRPTRPWPWRLIALCTLLTSIGIGIVPTTGETRMLGQALAGLGYVTGFGGFILLIRGRMPGGERSAFLDAAILAAGTGVLIWAFGFGPLAISARQSSIATAAFFYPALVATAVVARMWFLAGAHRPATRLIVLLVICSLGIAILDMVRGFVGQNALAGPYLFAEFASMAFAGAAALHPSMAVASERQHAGPEPVSPRRMVALVVALLVNPATLGIEVALGRAIDPAPYLIGGVLIGVLVIGRLSDALRQLGDSLRERESLMELLRRQALYDALTSLPNRSLFDDRLAADFANRSPGRHLAVLLLDLDDFKAVNDSYGHEVGDALLVAVGRRLRSAIRDGDIAARLGGDEFVIALPGCLDRLDPVRVAQRVLEALAQPYHIGGRTITTGATVGVAIAGPDDRTSDDLVRNADVAMYLAKRRGKGRLEVFEPSMHTSAMTQLQLRTDLAVAIAAGDLRLHYQPVVDLASGQTIGYEALVRWLRDGLLVAPGDFIPIAESSGLIGPLTDWVVDEACRTIGSWGQASPRPWVSVNLSSSQLLRRDIVTHLERALRMSGLPPDRLVVEITESSLLEIDVARPAIERLSRAGIRLAIDDFGTGYSALSYLARLPIDILKIDRSFVMALEQAGPEEAIASAIIALAKRLGLTTIGEGIETAAQLELLTALGCDLGQGFYLGRPAPKELPAPVRARADREMRLSLAPVSA
jgi:diguanylate cyclase (GGDEF)-like protein